MAMVGCDVLELRSNRFCGVGRGMTPCFGSLVSQFRDMAEIALGARGRRQIKKSELSLYVHITVAVIDDGDR